VVGTMGREVSELLLHEGNSLLCTITMIAHKKKYSTHNE
jgi:hypothetical protein